MSPEARGCKNKSFVTFPRKPGDGLLFSGKFQVTTRDIFQEKAIRLSFCHHAGCSSIHDASADVAAEHANFPDADISELLSLLRQVPEFRGKRGREYDLSFILAVCVVATLAGAKNYREIAAVASAICQCQLMTMGARWDIFRNCYRCPRRTLIREVLGKVDAAELDRIIGKWLLAQARKGEGEDGEIEWVIAIDGKVLRGSWTDENDTVTLFSAMIHVKGITIAQVRVPDETNETTQVKTLFRQAGIRDSESVLATLDAAHCNKETAEFIGGKPGWDYLITVKTDKPTLYREAKAILSPLLGNNPGNVMAEHSRDRRPRRGPRRCGPQRRHPRPARRQRPRPPPRRPRRTRRVHRGRLERLHPPWRRAASPKAPRHPRPAQPPARCPPARR
jgi:DDE_Tnp_1-associated